MIRLVTVIGHGVKLLPHFIKHYQHHVDEINIVVYETNSSESITNQVKDIIKNYDNVNIVKVVKDRIFDWEKVTYLYNKVKSGHPNDWWVVADIDEFHLYPNDNLKSLIKTCDELNFDLVRGGFIDRIGDNGEFIELEDETSIWEQYPNAGFFRYPLSYANPNKVCIMKGFIELTSGQHYAKIEGQTTWRWQGWDHPLIYNLGTVQVHHFKWDKTCIDRIKAVANVKQAYAYSDEYQTMHDKLRKSKFKIDLNKPEFMFELGLIKPEFKKYKNWNKLIKKIKTI